MLKVHQGSPFRWVVCMVLLVSGFAVLLVRLVFLQVVNAEELSRKATRQREKGVVIEAERGTIYDRRGRILATNLDVPSLFAIPPLIKNPKEIASTLSRHLDVKPESLRRRLESEKNFVWIKRKMDPVLARHIERLGFDGVGFLHESQRFYPKKQLLGQILGFAGMDNRGLEGIELRYDSVLRGEKGLMVLERDAGGRPIFPKDLNYVALTRGKDLVLTVDEVIQHIAERELDAVMEKSSPQSGSVIVMNPKTGEILAMAVRPLFDPNRVRGNNPERWRNRIIADSYEPGSTFKLVVASAALEEKVAEPEELFFCENGVLKLGRQVIHDHLKYGDLTFSEVIQKSSNIGSVKIALRLGEDTLYRYARKFGFAEKTGIDLEGEVSGLVRETHHWTGHSLASVAIGQEVAVTSLQMITAYSALANGGWLLRPYLVSEIRDKDRDRVERFTPEVRRQVIHSDTAKQLLEILEGVVADGGTAELARLEDYSVAGKTGTAQKIDPKTGRYSNEAFVSSFVGVVPSDDPKIVILVVVDSPKGEAWGGTVAAPVFKRIAEQTLRYLGVSPRNPEKLLLAAK